MVRLFPEIMVKSKSVRQRFTRLLESNLRNILKRLDEQTRIRNLWDRLEIEVAGAGLKKRAAVIDILASTPGIANFAQFEPLPYRDLDDLAEQVAAYWLPRLDGKTFCVRARRQRDCTISSLDVERHVGGWLNQRCATARVQLKDPDLTIRLDVDRDHFSLLHEQFDGLGGFPLASQEDVLSLISGGYDSAVSSFALIKRGSRVHYCFFNLGGAEHERGVRAIACHLWQRFGSSHRVKFISVPFEQVVEQIVERVDGGQMGVVLKRMMVRVASRLAERLQIDALVTGEAVGQVSSQTLTNLRLIDKVSDHLILRPLIASDKQEIIDQARRIGTAALSEALPEYCGVISRSPTVKAVEKRILGEEEKLDADLVDVTVRRALTIDMRELVSMVEAPAIEPETVAQLPQDGVVVDIRSREEQEASPLAVAGHAVVHIPFFRLEREMALMTRDEQYYLYCERGVMSRLQAQFLTDRGYTNIKVYRP